MRLVPYCAAAEAPGLEFNLMIYFYRAKKRKYAEMRARENEVKCEINE